MITEMHPSSIVTDHHPLSLTKSCLRRSLTKPACQTHVVSPLHRKRKQKASLFTTPAPPTCLNKKPGFIRGSSPGPPQCLTPSCALVVDVHPLYIYLLLIPLPLHQAQTQTQNLQEKKWWVFLDALFLSLTKVLTVHPNHLSLTTTGPLVFHADPIL